VEERIIDADAARLHIASLHIAMMTNNSSFERKSEEPPAAYPGAPPDSERAKSPPLPEVPYRPYEKAALPEAGYKPYAKKPGVAEAPYKPYEKPAVPEAPYKPYAKKPGAEAPYEPYKGM
jgi:hypothetical protein